MLADPLVGAHLGGAITERDAAAGRAVGVGRAAASAGVGHRAPPDAHLILDTQGNARRVPQRPQRIGAHPGDPAVARGDTEVPPRAVRVALADRAAAAIPVAHAELRLSLRAPGAGPARQGHPSQEQHQGSARRADKAVSCDAGNHRSFENVRPSIGSVEFSRRRERSTAHRPCPAAPRCSTPAGPARRPARPRPRPLR